MKELEMINIGKDIIEEPEKVEEPKKQEAEEELRPMGKMELEATINAAKGLDKRERLIFLGVFDTQELIDEINRRTHALEGIYLELCNELATVGKETTTVQMEKKIATLKSILRIPVQ